MNELLKTWLEGLEQGLQKVSQENQDTILRECGKNCADSFPVSVYQKAKRRANCLETFVKEVARQMPYTTGKVLSPKKYYIYYSKCGCDLARKKIFTSPLICRCSLLSVKYSLEKVFGLDVSVKEEQTIVKGGDYCQFLIEFKENPWQD